MTTRTRILIAAALVALGVAGRLLPHAWNFAPIVAIGLLSGARLGRGYGFAVPAIAMAASDAFIGFYDWQMNLTVYLAMALAGGIGISLRATRHPLALASGSVAASLAFYAITNAAVWKFGTMYDPGLSGLIASYAAGLPFLKNALVGDLWYTLAFFGAYELVQRTFARRRAIIGFIRSIARAL